MTENDDRNDQETEKKLFQKNGRGGPGRGNSRKRQEIAEVIKSIKELSQNSELNLLGTDVLDLIGRLILHDVTSKDTKTRIDSIKQLLNLLGKRIEAEEREKNDSSPTPEEVSRFAELVKLRQNTDVMDAEYAEEIRSLGEDIDDESLKE
jgi:hypothetical protein